MKLIEQLNKVISEAVNDELIDLFIRECESINFKLSDQRKLKGDLLYLKYIKDNDIIEYKLSINTIKYQLNSLDKTLSLEFNSIKDKIDIENAFNQIKEQINEG